mgnify:CR=1 FL=1
MAILIVAVVGQTVSPILSIYADKCEDDSKCDSKQTSDAEAENCKVEDSENKDKDTENSNMNVQNSNVQTSNTKCSDKDSHTNPHLLGEGPYSFPTDLLELPI